MALIKDKIKQQDKEEYAYKKMLSYGWTPDQAAGIVGNLIRESNLNTTILGTADTKGSKGIAQWHSGRLATLQNKYGSNWTDLDNQLDFVNWELNNTHKKAGDKLRTAQGVYNTGRIVSDDYERPKVKFHADTKRQNLVFNTYKKLSGNPLTDLDQQQFLQGTAQRAIDNYVPATKELSLTVTPEVSNFISPINIPTLAEPNETEAVQKAKEELDNKQQQQINQQRFIQDLLAASQAQYVDPNQVQDYTDQYYQKGGTYYDLPMNNPNILTPEQFTSYYINSPKYKERLIKSGYKNPDDVIKKRLEKINSASTIYQDGKVGVIEGIWNKITNTPYSNSGSAYDPEKNTIILDNTDKNKKSLKGLSMDFIEAHEIGHAEDNGFPINNKDVNSLFDRLKEYNLNNQDGITYKDREDIKNRGRRTEFSNITHDLRPEENKSDLNALRYILKKEGIYDAGKEDFTKEHLNKLKNNFYKKRLLDNYEEKDLIWLMNNVAQNDNYSNLTYAQTGGVQQSQDFLQNWYRNRVLPDPRLNEQYQAEKSLYTNQIKNLPLPNYVNQIDTENTQGTYDINTNRIDLLNTASPYVYTHEATHGINLPLKDTQSNVNAFSIIGENVIPKENIQNAWVKQNYPQISNYQEIIPRLNAYRQKYNLQPTQVITPDLIQQNRQQYINTSDYEDNTDQLYKLFENEGLSNVLNKVVSTNNINNQYYGQNGGNIPISSNGVYDYPKQEVIVPTDSGIITMKNVTYPILGVDEYGNQKMMYPGQEYQFKGKIIHEIPQLKRTKNKRFS